MYISFFLEKFQNCKILQMCQIVKKDTSYIFICPFITLSYNTQYNLLLSLNNIVLLIVVLLSLQRFVLSPNLSVRFLCDRKYCHIVSESFFAPPEQKTVYSSHIISYPYMNIDYLISIGTGNRSLFCIISKTNVKNLSHILTLPRILFNEH